MVHALYLCPKLEEQRQAVPLWNQNSLKQCTSFIDMLARAEPGILLWGPGLFHSESQFKRNVVLISESVYFVVTALSIVQQIVYP